ncbi:MAG: hypothetical protein RIR11_4004 [Bacteroidota bacterium]
MEITAVKSNVGMKWEMVKLGDVCDVLGGYAFKSENFKNEGVPLLRISNITDGEVSFKDDCICVEDSNLSSLQRFKVIKGDILLALSGATTGKFGVYKLDYFSFLNQRVGLIKSTEKTNQKYLIYYLNVLKSQIKQIAQGAARPNISTNEISNLQIPLPPLATQKRIAEILDAADALRRKDQALLQKYDELAQAIFMDMFGDPVKNEKGWEVKKLGDIIRDIEAGSSYGGEDKILDDDEFGVLKVSAVTSGKFRPEEYKAVKKSIIQKNPIFVQQGDFLFSRANTRDLVGATCIVDKDYDYLFLPDKIWKIIFIAEKCNPIFIKSFLSQKSVRYELNKTATGTSGSMLNISMQKLKDLPVIIPPISLQNNYRIFYNSLQNMRSNSTDVNINSLALFQTLLQKAFNGELVP